MENKNFKKLEVKDYVTNVFTDFKEDWALCTAGSLKDHNSLTIGWGSLGVLWRKNVCTVYVRGSRYTNNYLLNNDYFTVSFYSEEYREALKMYGTVSGRDKNKDELSGFKAFYFDGGISYEEADLVIVCKKIYQDDFKPELFLSKDIDDFYAPTIEKDPTYHYYYIGEIVSIYKKVKKSATVL